ncbi:MAG: C69 family dipeptidase [Tissierellia bacterium]|nr:C69 family dipeptidase [Tissierellia bacterium]
MKTYFKKFLATVLVAVLLLAPVSEVFACTGVIVGRGVAADGNPIIGRTEDWSSAYNKTVIATPAKTYQKGEMYEDVYGFTYPMPEKTYATVTVPDGYQDEGDVFEATGWNDQGVTMTATVTASANDQALAADPLTDHGLYESSVVSVVLPRIKTAREGVELLAEIMDTKGVQEGAVIVLADQSEIWYMELLTGHQYVAVKYPDDSYSVFPNCFMLGTVDVTDTENVVASKDLVNLPKQHGFLVEEDGLIHVQKTYAEPLASGNRDRLWGGINFLDPDKNIPHDSPYFELFQKTDKKISVKDVMEFQRTRYEGTEKDANLPENAGKVRPIGTVNQEHAHVIQIKENYPKELGGILWVAMGNAEHAQYVPIFGPITDSIAAYQVPGDQYTPESAYWTMRQVSALSEINRELYGPYVREYYDLQEREALKRIEEELDGKLIQAFEKSTEEGRKLATEISMEFQQKAYDDATQIVKELNTYFFDTSNDSGVNGTPGRKVKPFIPSLLGDERRAEILKELGFTGGPGSAQPLDKGSEVTGDELENHWAKASMEQAIASGWLEKVDGKFLPNKVVYVEDLLKLLAVKNGEFKVDSLDEVLNQYVIGKNYVLNRQSAAIILDAYGQLTQQAPENKNFEVKDQDEISPWSQDAVNRVLNRGWLTLQEGRFYPSSQMNRAELSALAARI